MTSLRYRVGALLGRTPEPPEFPPDFDEHDIAEHRAVKQYTMTSPERILALRNGVRHIVAAGIEGDIVECGVWRGGSMLAVARTLLDVGDTSRNLYLFDTFEGMSEPTEDDRMYSGQAAAELLEGHDREERVWAYAPLEGVRELLTHAGYPNGKLHFVKGKVEHTIPEAAPARIALLRLDTDWYESTRHVLVHLYPRLARHGVLIVDDYGHWEGARKAVDEYFADSAEPVFLHRVDYTARLVVKYTA